MRNDKKNGRFAAAASGSSYASLLRWVLSASLLLGAMSAQAALQARDLNGDTVTDAYYDTVLDITWLRDWNYARTSGYDSDGLMNWSTANAWAQNLSFGGYADWRLPTMVDTGTVGCDWSFAGGTDCGYNVQTIGGSTVYSEVAHLYYVTLGSEGFCLAGNASCSVNGAAAGWDFDPQTDYAAASSGTWPFANMQAHVYWSGLEYLSSSSGYAWIFNTGYGNQGADDKRAAFYAVAVRPGDVAAAVPEPQALALTLLALGVAGAARRRRRR
jgi:hypothetical protein